MSSLLSALACSRAPVDLDAQRSAIINGDDDRLQAFEVPAEKQEPLLGASAALIFAHHLRENDANAVQLRAPDASRGLGLCEDEAFAREPVAAFCSAVLIDDDLVATAGHCLGADPERAARRCHNVRVAFGYALSGPEAPIELDPERVFACRMVVALEPELAIIQLERTANQPSLARNVAAEPASAGLELIVASHPAGLPLKIELAATVTEVTPGSGALTVAMDTFTGSSGGGLYNQALELLGLIENGAPDWEVIDGCTRAAHGDVPRERALSAQRLTKAVCDAGWPSSRLCDRPPKCRDGICNGGEARTCQADCPAARCGDELCERGERGTCPEDCARYPDVPESWLDDPERYPHLSGGAATSSGPTRGCSLALASHAPLLPAWSMVFLYCLARQRRRRARPALR